MHIPGCQKNGTFHTGIQKNGAIHILFVEKRGPIIYLAALKKGAIRHAHPYYAVYGKLSPRPRAFFMIVNLSNCRAVYTWYIFWEDNSVKVVFVPFWKGVYLIMKTCAPRGSNVFPYRGYPFSEGVYHGVTRTGSHKCCLPCKKCGKFGKCVQSF